MSKISLLSAISLTLLLSSCGSTTALVPSTTAPTTMVTTAPTKVITNTASPTAHTSASITPTTMPTTKPVIVTMKTSMGDIKLQLESEKAPNTVANFVKLAKQGFYDGVLFHRVIPQFMIQSGDPNSKDSDPYNDGMGGPGYKFADEFGEGLSNARGTIAMANSGPNTNGSQFFINVVDNTFLDHRHAVFGKVIAGLDVADKIVSVATNKTDPRLKDRPVKDVKILKVTIE